MSDNTEIEDSGHATPRAPGDPGGAGCSVRRLVRFPSFKRGCERIANHGRSYEKQAEKMNAKHGKEYGVYHCPYCEGTHLTTKLEKRHEYPPLIYQTNGNWPDATHQS